MGSLNKFGWLSTENVTFLRQAIETRYEIPLRLMARGFSSLIARKNFDSAQDDIQRFDSRYAFIFREPQGTPLPRNWMFYGEFKRVRRFQKNVLHFFVSNRQPVGEGQFLWSKFATERSEVWLPPPEKERLSFLKTGDSWIAPTLVPFSLFVNSHKTSCHIFLKNIGFWGFQGAIFVI